VTILFFLFFRSTEKKKKRKKKSRKRRHRYLPSASAPRKNKPTDRKAVPEAETSVVLVNAEPATATVGGKIYPKCLPKHALKALSSEAEVNEKSNGDGHHDPTQIQNGGKEEEEVRKADKKVPNVDTRVKKGAANGQMTNNNHADRVVDVTQEAVTNGDIPFSDDVKKIVVTKIEDIPTRPDSPKDAAGQWSPLPSSPPPLVAESQHSRKKFERNTFVAASDAKSKRVDTHSHAAGGGGGGGGGGGATRLKFGLLMPSNKRLLQSGGPSTLSTFAELSNKLGPLGHRKNGLKQQAQPLDNKIATASSAAAATFVTASEMMSSTSSGRLPPLKEHIRQIEEAVAAEVASTAAAVAAAASAGGGGSIGAATRNNNEAGGEELDAATDVVDMELEESFVETAGHHRQTSHSRSRSRAHDSRSRSRSRSRRSRRSRSRSYDSHSRSRSRGSYYSRSSSSSRSRSYSSSSSASSYSSRSRSRTRTRSPSIQRRRGSPSFLDKRRITR
jgi:hypothetical protein